MLIIWTVTNGLADDIAVEDLKRFEEELTTFIEKSHPAVLNTIREKKSIDDDLKAVDERSGRGFQSDALEQRRSHAAKA